jgi:3-oxoadipate enol-lactonase
VTAAVLHHAVRGDGPPVLFVHAGIADSRMWDGFAERLVAGGHRTIACDLRGFGRSPLTPGVVSNAADLLALLDHLGLERAAVVGASFGGLQALDLALRAPDRVSALVLLGSVLDEFDASAELDAFDAAEEAAVEAGDLDAATEANVRFWIERPGERPAEDVDPAVLDLVRTMQRAAFAAQMDVDAALDAPDPPVARRLADVAMPTLVVVGADDVADFVALARRLAHGIPGAGPVVTIARAAHLPALERPAETAAVVLDFLA